MAESTRPQRFSLHGHRVMTAVKCKDTFHVGGFRRHVGELVNEDVAVEAEHRIPSFLESNRGHRSATQAGAARGSGEVSGIDLYVVRQRQQLLVQAGMELLGIFAGPTWKIRATDRADEQGIPR